MAEQSSVPKWSGEPLEAGPNGRADSPGADMGAPESTLESETRFSGEERQDESRSASRYDGPSERRRAGLIVLALVVLLPLALVGAGAIGYLLATRSGDQSAVVSDGDQQAVVDTTAALTEEEDPASPNVEDDAEPESEPGTTIAVEDVPTSSTAPLTAADIQAHLDETANGDPTPRAIFRDGQVTLVGAVPMAELAATIEARASSVIGEENVTNRFIVDPSSTFSPSEDPFNVVLDDVILFDIGSAEIDPEYQGLVTIANGLVSRSPQVVVTVVGYTDSSGATDFNERLARERAEAVAAVFVSNGIDADRVKVEARGEVGASTSGDADDEQFDRRVELIFENLLS
ncbi:MAG: OmpA family protein [Acidimicrobiales bacterium]